MTEKRPGHLIRSLASVRFGHFEGGWSSEKVVKNIKITIKLLILLTAVMWKDSTMFKFQVLVSVQQDDITVGCRLYNDVCSQSDIHVYWLGNVSFKHHVCRRSPLRRVFHYDLLLIKVQTHLQLTNREKAHLSYTTFKAERLVCQQERIVCTNMKPWNKRLTHI